MGNKLRVENSNILVGIIVCVCPVSFGDVGGVGEGSRKQVSWGAYAFGTGMLPQFIVKLFQIINLNLLMIFYCYCFTTDYIIDN